MSSTPRIRMSPTSRREQLLDLGVRMLSTRSLDELSIEMLAEEAGISRGLLYHYFGNKHDFHQAVVRRAADDLIAQTAPPDSGTPGERLLASMAAYLDYVVANHEGYLSLVKGAAAGNPEIRAIHDEARAALTDRLFDEGSEGMVLNDTAATRLLVHAWAAFAEDVALTWAQRPDGISRGEVLELLAGSLPVLVPLVE